MANKPNQVTIDPAGARNAPVETDESTSPEQGTDESDQDYLKRRSSQARQEAQQRSEPVTTEALPGATEDLAGQGKPIGAGESFTRGSATPRRGTTPIPSDR